MKKETLLLRAFSFLKIPLIFFLRPSVLELSDKRAVVKMPLGWVSKNHLGSMYFGALCTGADCAGGIMAMSMIKPYGKRGSLVFKNFTAEFLARPNHDVYFVCDDGAEIAALVARAVESGERVDHEITVNACAKDLTTVVARFKMLLSLKVKKAA